MGGTCFGFYRLPKAPFKAGPGMRTFTTPCRFRESCVWSGKAGAADSSDLVLERVF